MKKLTILFLSFMTIVVLSSCGPQMITVTFDVGNGTTLTEEIESGTAVTQPSDPDIVGYEFLGWFTDTTMTTEYDFATIITDPTTVYAGWQYLFTPLTGLTQTVMDEIQADEELWYRIIVTETTRLSIYSTGNTDLYGFILDEDEVAIDEDDNSFDFEKNFQFIFDFAPGTYYIVVQGYDETTSGTFNLEIREVNELENVATESYTLDAGFGISYTFDLTASGTYHFYTTGDTDTYGYLMDGSETILLEDDDMGLAGNCYIIAYLEAGSYEFFVEGYDSTTTGDFNLIIDREVD